MPRSCWCGTASRSGSARAGSRGRPRRRCPSSAAVRRPWPGNGWRTLTRPRPCRSPADGRGRSSILRSPGPPPRRRRWPTRSRVLPRQETAIRSPSPPPSPSPSPSPSSALSPSSVRTPGSWSWDRASGRASPTTTSPAAGRRSSPRGGTGPGNPWHPAASPWPPSRPACGRRCVERWSPWGRADRAARSIARRSSATRAWPRATISRGRSWSGMTACSRSSC